MFRLAFLVTLVVSLNSYGDVAIPGLRPDGTYPSPGELVPLVGGGGTGAKGGGTGAMEAVNAARAQRGLRPFIEDPSLSVAAQNAAQYRADHRIAGHTNNDFNFVPNGSNGAKAAGCAAWPQSMGWGSCCAYENYTYAGAGWAIGSDGLRYMHLFVR